MSRHSFRFGIDVFNTFLIRAVTMAAGFLIVVIIARKLGVEAQGTYALAIAVAGLGVQIIGLGLHASNTFIVAQDRSLLTPLLGNSIVFGIAAGSIAGILILCVLYLRPNLIPIHGALLIGVLFSIPIGLTLLLVQNFLLAMQRARLFNISSLVSRGLALFFVAGAVILGSKKISVLYFLTVTASFIALALSVNHIMKLCTKPIFISFKLFRQNIGYGLKAYLAALFSYLVIRQDLFMIQNMMNREAVGYYSVSSNVAEFLLGLQAVIGLILFPYLSAMTEHKSKWLMAKKTTINVGIAMTSICIFVFLLSHSGVIFVFGPEYSPAISALNWLLPGVVCLSMASILQNYFAAAGDPGAMIYGPLIAALLNVVMNMFFIPALGIVGAAVASTIAYFVMLVISLHLFIRKKNYLDRIT